MRSSIASAINSQVQMHAFLTFFLNQSYHSLVLAGVSSFISGNISSPFVIVIICYCKERYCDCVSSGIFPTQFKKSRLLFYNDKVFARIQIKNENI